MKAMVATRYGGPEVFALRDMPDPVAGPGEVLVDIHAATVNPVDYKICEGERRDRTNLTFPCVHGIDFSGVVRALGEGVTEFKPGDAVWGVTDQGMPGSYAEMIAIEAASHVARKPDALSHADAAALGLVALTSLVSLEDTAQVKRGDTVLIHRAAGGVGGFGVEYAHYMGATVYATASERNHDYVRGLGADVVIDYNTQDFTRLTPPCDVVFDTVGGEVHRRSFGVLKPGGRLVYVAPPPDDFVAPRNDVEVIRTNTRRTRKRLDRIMELVALGAVHPPAITHITLADIPEAHRLSKAGHVRGKLVIDVR